jgi:hypothetical protein
VFTPHISTLLKRKPKPSLSFVAEAYWEYEPDFYIYAYLAAGDSKNGSAARPLQIAA